jgi:two-component system LytT family response regulator
MTIVIIDDEQHCTDRIRFLLQSYIPHAHITCFTTVPEAIKGIEEQRPDIVFLDVHLNDETGFDVLSAVSYRNFNLIFTTAYEQYAIRAFKLSAIDYLLKPVDQEDFENAMQKALKKIEQEQLYDRIDVLLSHLSSENLPRKISIPSKEGYTFLDIADIIRCEADVNYTHIFLSDGKKYTVSKSLKYFEELLSQQNFFRIHNSHLINIAYVKTYDRGGYVILSNHTKLEVSIRRKEEFFKVLGVH